MLRDKFKDEKYFIAQTSLLDQNIQREKTRIQNAENKAGKELPKNNYYIVSNGLCIYIYQAYSLGNTIESLVAPCREMLGYYIKSWHTDIDYSDGGDIVYSELLSMISLGVLLDTKQELIQLHNLIRKVNYNDYLVDFLLQYAQKDSAIHPGLLWEDDEACKKLKEITVSVDKAFAESKMQDYLENNFYTKENLEEVYNSHKRKDNSYSGYWSFESGAIVKVMQLNDSLFKNNPYYPYDMVRWPE